MIIGVTGSRDWTSRGIISDAYDEALADFPSKGNLVAVILGKAKGADTLCEFEAISRGWHVAGVRALWGFYGDSSGHIRNDAMIYIGMNAFRWLAFINPCIKADCPVPRPHDSHGAAGCVKHAKAAGLDVREYRNG